MIRTLDEEAKRAFTPYGEGGGVELHLSDRCWLRLYGSVCSRTTAPYRVRYVWMLYVWGVLKVGSTAIQ